ncbi:MAG: bacteriohemerythrin [Candidatus Delongbacteria bacterium]
MGWLPAYDTGVEAMDKQHHRLLEMLNELSAAIHSGKGNAEGAVWTTINQLFDYAKVHFHDEEEFMRRYFYPGLQEHIVQHGILVEKLVEQLEQFKHGKLPPVKLGMFLRDWIVKHMVEEDQKYGAFYAKRKRSLS